MNPDDLVIIGDHDNKTRDQMRAAVKDDAVVAAALLPDGHYGYGVPIGGVIAYDDAVSPSGVGYDIGCGVIAVDTGAKWEDLAPHRDEIADYIASTVEFGLGSETGGDHADHPVFESDRWDDLPIGLDTLKDRARQQLGSVGSGNHYVDVLRASDGTAWVAAHFGSRGFGHTVASWFLKLLGAKDHMDALPAVIRRATAPTLFDAYVDAMTLAGEYAYAGREIVAQQVVDILASYADVDVQLTVHNHHNYAWLEDGLWVVRKGATPLAPGQTGFVGGSMNDKAVVLEGCYHDSGQDTLWSSIHGAGRVMSRTKAAGKYKRNPETGKRERTRGVITPERHAEATAGVTVRGGGYDESPDVYRRLDDVLFYMPESTLVHTSMTPKIVVMAGADVRDPYKD